MRFSRCIINTQLFVQLDCEKERSGSPLEITQWFVISRQSTTVSKEKVRKLNNSIGPVAKLVDALDLGSSAFGVRVRVSPGPPLKPLKKEWFFYALRDFVSAGLSKFYVLSALEF